MTENNQRLLTKRDVCTDFISQLHEAAGTNSGPAVNLCDRKFVDSLYRLAM